MKKYSKMAYEERVQLYANFLTNGNKEIGFNDYCKTVGIEIDTEGVTFEGEDVCDFTVKTMKLAGKW